MHSPPRALLVFGARLSFRQALIGATLGLVVKLHAGIIVWSDTGTDFGTGANWGGAAPANDLVTDIAEFGVVVTNQPALAANRSVNGLRFSSTSAVTLSGAGTLALGAGGLVNASLTGAKTVSTALTLGGAQSFANSGTLTVSGAVANGGHLLTLDGTGAAGALTGIVSGTGGLAKTGAGTWIVSGANTFTGATTVAAGTLRATTAAGALGTGAATLALTGGNLALANNTALNFARNTTVSANTTISSDRLTSGAGVTHTLGTLSIGAHTLAVARGSLATSGTGGLTFGVTTLTGDATFAPAANALLTLGAVGQSGGSRSLTKTGAGTLTLAGTTGTYDGITTILGGTVNAAVLAHGGVTSSIGLSGNSAANLVLDGGALTYNGTAVRATDRLFTLGTGGGSLGASGSAANTITFTHTGDIALTGADTARTFTLTGTNTAANTLAARLTDNGAGATSLAKTAAGSWVLTAAHTYTGTTAISGGTLALAGAGAISANNLVLSGGVLATNDTLGFSRTIGTGAGQVRWSGGGGGFAAYGGPLTVGFASTAWGGAHFIPNGQALILGSALATHVVTWNTDLNFGATTRTITVNDNTATTADYAHVTGALGGTGGLVKNGAGTLLLTGANTFTGATAVSAGTLLLGGGATLSAANLALNGGGVLAASDTTLGGALARGFGTGAGQIALSSTGGAGLAAYGGALTFTPGAATWGGTAGFFSASTGPLIFGSLHADNVVTWTSDFSVGATARIITVNDNAATASDYAVLAGAISGTAATLTKNGAGRLDLTGLNTYTGKTLLSAGTLTVNTLADLAAASSLGAPGTVANGTIAIGASTASATLAYTGSGSTTNRVIDLAGTTGGATLDSSGSGALVFTSALTATGAGSKTLTLTGTNHDTNELQGAIVNNSGSNRTSVLKTGAGTWQLGGANTYTGATTVNQGTLRLGPAGALPNTAVSVTSNTVGGAALLDLNGVSATVASLTLGGGTGADAASAAHVATGAGTLTLGGNVTFTATGNPLGSTLSGNLALGAANRTFTVNESTTAAEDLTVSAAISGGFGLVKAGAGTLVLSGANTYTGSTSVTAGRLRATASAQALGAGALTLGSATLSLANDTGLNFGRNTALTASTTVESDRLTGGAGVTHTLGTLSQGAFTLSLNAGGNVASGTAGLAFGNTTLTGNAAWSPGTGTQLSLGSLTGGATARAMVKTGAGTLVFSAASGTITTASSLTVNNGTVRLDASHALGATALTGITLNATTVGTTALLDLNGFSQTVLALTFGGTGATATSTNAVTTGAGTLTLGGTLTFTSTNNPLGASLAGHLDLGAASRSFAINDSTNAPVDLALSAAIAGTGVGLTKSGAGTLALSGNNTYSGPTTLSAGTTIASADAALGAGALTLGGGTLVLQNDADLAVGRNTTLTTNSTVTVDRATSGAAPVHTLGSLTFNTNTRTLTVTPGDAVTSGTATLVFGNVALNATAPAVNVAADTQVSFGALSDNGTARAFVKSGDGTLELAAASGTITTASTHTVTGGATRLAASDALGAAARTNLVLNATTGGGTALLDLAGFNQTILALTFGGTGATSTSTNTVTLGGGTLTLGGNVSALATNDPLGATISGAGSVNLGGATRTFAIGNSANASPDLAISSAITGTGGLTKTGAGTLLLSGANTYTGATTVNTGTVLLGSSAALPATAVTVNATTAGATALLDLNGHDAAVTTLTFGGTGGTATSTGNVATGAGTLTLGGTVTYTNTGAPLGSTLSGHLDLGAAVRTFNIGDSANAASDLAVSAATAATTGGIAKSGAGTLLLSGDNQHNGGTSVTVGTLALAHNNAAGTGPLTLGGGTLRGDGAALTLANVLTLNASTTVGGASELSFTGKLTNTGNFTLTLANSAATTLAAVDLSNSAGNRTLTLALSGGDVSVGGIIANGGTSTASALVKSGAGTLTLSATNTYGGATAIQAGTLSLNSLANVSGGASALGAPTSAATGTLAVGATTNSATLRYTGTGHSSNRVVNLAGTTGGATLDASGSGALVLTSALTATGAGSKTLTLTGTSTAANTLGGAIVNHSGVNLTALVKTGAGTWELGGASTFTGGITLDAGTLTLKSGASLAAANTLALTGGTLNLNNTAQTLTSLAGPGGTINFGTGHTLTLAQITATTYEGVFAGAGHLLLNGSAGSMTLSGGGANTRSGNTTVNAGTLILAKTSGTNAIAGGTITLAGASSYLRLGASHQIGATAGLALAGGTFQLNNFSESLGSLRLDSHSTIDFGATASALVFTASSAQTWSGTLTVSNYTVGSNSLRFGTSATGLSSGQLAQINFTGFGAATINAGGFVSPIPEPSTYALFAGLAGLALTVWRGHRRARAPA